MKRDLLMRRLNLSLLMPLKKTSMTSIICLMLVIVIMPKLATGMPMPIRTHIYLQTKAQYELFHGQYDVVMFGDSLTERGHWSDMFPSVRIGNRGIGGDDTQGMLERIQSIESTGAKTVFIMAGTNDLSRSVQQGRRMIILCAS